MGDDRGRCLAPTLKSRTMWALLLRRRSASRSRSIAPADIARDGPLCSNEISPAAMVEPEADAPQLSPSDMALAPNFVALLLLLARDPCQTAVHARELESPESESSLSSKFRVAGDGFRARLREEGAGGAGFFGDVPRRGSTLDGNDAVLEPICVE